MTRFTYSVAVLLAFVSTGAAQNRLRVVTTTSDLRSLAKAVGGELITVSSLVPPGDKPEAYLPRLQDIGILKGTRVVLRAGSGIDPWFDKLLARAAKKNGPTGIERGEAGHIDGSLAIAAQDALAVSAGFAPPPRVRGGPFPHYWLDPKTADEITAKIAATFSALDPQGKRNYEANREAFLVRLNSKIREWEARLAPLRGVPMVAYHDDWTYFAGRFKLQFVDFIATRDSAPPRRSRIAELVKMMRERGIRLIVSEPNQPERHARRVAQQADAKLILLAGSVGVLPGAADYISLFDTNVNALVAAIEKR
ncbi:MAG: zinc ABC transporter substrate-binding protein [Rhizobiales bacterium]|nr:zinc ABC transporter substrate-binding protein [Hyphomicrobiales bacterium]